MPLTYELVPFCFGALNLSALNLSATLTAMLIPLAAIVLGGVIAICAMYFSHQQKQMLHETARLALEKGQPLSAELFETLNKSMSHRSKGGGRNDIRTGLILIALGAGLYLFSPPEGSLRFIGAIPGLIGVALLLYGILEPLFSRKKPNDDRGAQP